MTKAQIRMGLSGRWLVTRVPHCACCARVGSGEHTQFRSFGDALQYLYLVGPCYR